MRSYLIVALLAAVALAACARTDVVATVNDADIPTGDVLALRNSYEDATVLVGEDFRGDLTRVILTEAALQAAREDFGLTGLADQERVDARKQNLSAGEQQVIATIVANSDFTEAAIDLQVAQFILREEVAHELVLASPEVIEQAIENPEAVARVCARHILTETRREAEAARDRLEAGEDFSMVAGEVSLDAQSPGGVLPCPSLASSFVAPFGVTTATAPLGEIVGPIQTQFGWHIIIVDDRVAPSSVEELREDPTRFINPSTVSDLWALWLDAAVRDSDIWVASQVGRWVPEADGILPPPDG